MNVIEAVCNKKVGGDAERPRFADALKRRVLRYHAVSGELLEMLRAARIIGDAKLEAKLTGINNRAIERRKTYAGALWVLYKIPFDPQSGRFSEPPRVGLKRR